MLKVTSYAPETDPASPYENLDSRKLHKAAERALDHYFAPTKKPFAERFGQLFSICPEITTEALLANASEDLRSISAIAADLADDVDGPHHSIALALSRMADGVQLMVERVLDDLEEPEMAMALARRQGRLG